MKSIFMGLCGLLFLHVSAQNDLGSKTFPKHKIWLYTSDGNVIKGIVTRTSDSTVDIFPGKFSEWNATSRTSVQSYSIINNIKTHKKGGLIKGILYGAGSGLLPLVAGAALGEGEGGAYVSIVAFPLGIITGAIIGATSKRKFFINGEASRFYSFHKRMRY